MKYFVFSVAGIISCCFLMLIGRTAYLAWTDNPYWIFVGLGLMFPTIVLVLITTAAYSAARDY